MAESPETPVARPAPRMEHLPGGAISNRSRAEYAYSTWFVPLPAGATLADCFRPNFWSHHIKQFKRNDMLRIRAEDGSFDFMATVADVRIGGMRIETWPKMADETAEVESSGVNAVEKSGGWCPRIEYRKATNWRVIGHDGNEHSAGHDSKEVAAQILMRYMADLGFSPAQVNEHMRVNLQLGSLMDKAA